MYLKLTIKHCYKDKDIAEYPFLLLMYAVYLIICLVESVPHSIQEITQSTTSNCCIVYNVQHKNIITKVSQCLSEYKVKL